MSGRVLTDEQLAELAEPPRRAVARHLAAGDGRAATGVVRRMETELAGQVDRYTHWLASLFAFAAERHGSPGSAAMLHATRRLFAGWPQLGSVEAALPTSVVEHVAGAGGLDAFDEADRRWRDVIDLHRDWISALLSEVYRSWGIDELEAAHRHVGARTMAGLTSGLGSPAAERYERFVWLLKGHFSELRLEEHADRLVITQDPCGTCGRQARAGRHLPPLELAVVEEEHAVTWGEGATTIYRTHVPVWHVLMATELLGVPWPVNQCPRGPADGVCTIVLYQDPRDPRARDGIPGALGALLQGRDRQ